MIEYVSVCLIVKTYIFGPVFEQTLAINLSGCVQKSNDDFIFSFFLQNDFFTALFFIFFIFILKTSQWQIWCTVSSVLQSKVKSPKCERSSRQDSKQAQ